MSPQGTTVKLTVTKTYVRSFHIDNTGHNKVIITICPISHISNGLISEYNNREQILMRRKNIKKVGMHGKIGTISSE